MADLKITYKDDILDTSVNERRKYQMIQNEDGTVSFVDVTEYSQEGDSFGSLDINATNLAINELNSNLEYHIEDTITFSEILLTGCGSTSGGIAGGFNIFLGKNIGKDVTNVTVNVNVSNIRFNGTDNSDGSATILSAKILNNVVTFGVQHSKIPALEVITIICKDLTITFS